MELVLTKTVQNQVAVACDGWPSHSFSLSDLPADRQTGQVPPPDPVEMGQRLFAVLFAEETHARAAWDARPKRILLVAEDPSLDAIPWEYLCGPDGFIALDVALVRGLPPAKRQPSPDLSGTPLHIVAIPSNPIDPAIARLDIEGEWTRLKGSLTGLDTTIRLERARPPTLEQTRRLTANQRNRVVHFMGHGGHNSAGSHLVFEKDNGAPDLVTARDFIRRLEDAAFLVTLNACSSAQSGATEFANLARALAERGVPYTLGMRSPIPDDDAKAFATTFYGELARGSSVENALRQARNTLADSRNAWAVGIPVLYTSLAAPSDGFVTPAGTPRIDEHQPPLEISALPRAEGTFQGRVDELLQLGDYLTAHEKVVTIHGPGGQGKTALAREVAERFAHAWPGGVWAVSLEHNSALERFTLELARLLKIDLDGIYKQMAAAHPNQETDVFQGYVQQELERRICHILNRERALLVLDNAETFTEAINAKDKSALDLAAFLKEKILSTQAGLLVTSREHLGWTGEKAIELGGLLPEEGARLFWQSAPGRGKEAVGPQAQEISRKVEGHPLSLRLLGGAFDASGVSLDAFGQQVEDALLHAEDKYRHEDHRHKTLFASIETSVRYLDENTRALLGGLWIFESPFQPEIATQVFEPLKFSQEEANDQQYIAKKLYVLFQRSLLTRQEEALINNKMVLYQILPPIRLFSKYYIVQELPIEVLHSQIGKIFVTFLSDINHQIDRTAQASYLARCCRQDLELGVQWVARKERCRYMNRLGRVIQRLGDHRSGLRWLEQALAYGQNQDKAQEPHILNNIASLYYATGRPKQALTFLEQALPLSREFDNRDVEATTLNNFGEVYRLLGQPWHGLGFLKQALSIRREISDRSGEAVALNNMAVIYRITGEPEQALTIFEQVLPIRREVGNRIGEATTLNNMGSLYYATGRLEQALELLMEARLIMHEVNYQTGEATIINNIASIHSSMGQYEQALGFLEQALSLLQKAGGDRVLEATILNNIGEFYRVAKRPEQALENFEQALTIMREVGNLAGEATILNNLGETYQAMGQPKQALVLFQRSLPIEHEVGDQEGEAITFSNIGQLHRDMGNYEQAEAVFKQSLLLSRNAGHLASAAITCFNIATLAREMGRPQQAIEFLRQAVELEKKVQHPDYLKDAAMLAQWDAEFQDNGQLPNN